MNLDRSFYRFVTIHACDGQTDRQTDRNLITIPRLHYMQRGKNCSVKKNESQELVQTDRLMSDNTRHLASSYKFDRGH